MNRDLHIIATDMFPHPPIFGKEPAQSELLITLDHIVSSCGVPSPLDTLVAEWKR